MDRVLADKALLGRSGFARGSALYERARPGYSDESVGHLLDRPWASAPASRVLDIAAGTGKLTRALVASGAAVVASEPSASMREVFADVAARTRPRWVRTAEQLPFADHTFDAVTVAQAFHWFDAPAALGEIARVLRPGGGLALVWNERDESDPVVAELTRISKWDVHQPYPVGMDFGAVIDASRAFGPVTRTRFPFAQELDRLAFVEQVASRSYIAVLPDDRRRPDPGRVAALAARLDEPIALPYIGRHSSAPGWPDTGSGAAGLPPGSPAGQPLGRVRQRRKPAGPRTRGGHHHDQADLPAAAQGGAHPRRVPRLLARPPRTADRQLERRQVRHPLRAEPPARSTTTGTTTTGPATTG